MAGHLILMLAVRRPGARAVSNTEQENSFGGTEGSLFGVEEGQLVGGCHTGWGSKGCREPTF